MAGIVMLVIGLVALVFTVIGAIGSAKEGEDLVFFADSWFPIMFIFWFGAGLSLLLTFPANEDRREHRHQR